MTETPNDEELMLAYGAGDARAFETLFDRYKGRIYSYLLRHSGDRGVAEDLFQKTFLRVHGARRRYRPSAPFSSWIYRIARNLWRDELRGRQRARAEHAAAEAAVLDAVTPEHELQALEMRERIEAAVKSLPAEQREAFLLARYEGKPSREAAAILGCSEAAARVRLHRALKTLREVLWGNAHAM